ncbi:MAG: OmpA family protein [Geminicoccaceae bacterium]|nr:OmpA family protein [Geminicoccaceae bacterium]
MISASPAAIAARGRGPAALLLAALLVLSGAGAVAQEPFAPGWTMAPELSKLDVQSVKNETKVESSTFAAFEGAIAPDGQATVTIQLNSIDTGVDLRNVRMRFLFFETFKYPEAVVTVQLDRAMLGDLESRRRLNLTLPFELDLHGITKELETEVVLTLLTDELVSVASSRPISIGTELFDLTDGLKKLEEAASVSVIPSGSVTFDFVFRRNDATGPVIVAAAPSATSDTTGAATAVETKGDFSAEECAGRFDIMSRTGAIYFRTGSAVLDQESRPLLDTVVAIVERCPGVAVRVAGHTDSVGPDELNQALSEARARSVTTYLEEHGVPAARLQSIGYGETRPVAPNDTPWNRSRNRRIEFLVVGEG